VVEFYLKLRLILRLITYLTYICWEINNFVIKSDLFRRFFICKNILKKLSCYHDNYFRYFMFGKYNGFVSKARVFACMYFLVVIIWITYVEDLIYLFRGRRNFIWSHDICCFTCTHVQMMSEEQHAAGSGVTLFFDHSP
jgi:hypothetical protein